MRLSLMLLIPILVASFGCATCNKSDAKVFVRRLEPGRDLRLALKKWAEDENFRAASVVSAVGSLNFLNLRYANQPNGTKLQGPVEIVSLTGTLAKSGMHLHISVSDKNGQTLGGHLIDGSSIYTTAEVTVIEASNLEFQRIKDHQTGYDELFVQKR